MLIDASVLFRPSHREPRALRIDPRQPPVVLSLRSPSLSFIGLGGMPFKTDIRFDHPMNGQNSAT